MMKQLLSERQASMKICPLLKKQCIIFSCMAWREMDDMTECPKCHEVSGGWVSLKDGIDTLSCPKCHEDSRVTTRYKAGYCAAYK